MDVHARERKRLDVSIEEAPVRNRCGARCIARRRGDRDLRRSDRCGRGARAPSLDMRMVCAGVVASCRHQQHLHGVRMVCDLRQAIARQRRADAAPRGVLAREMVVESVAGLAEPSGGPRNGDAVAAALGGPVRAVVERRADERRVAVAQPREHFDEALVGTLVVAAVRKARIDEPARRVGRVGQRCLLQ